MQREVPNVLVRKRISKDSNLDLICCKRSVVAHQGTGIWKIYAFRQKSFLLHSAHRPERTATGVSDGYHPFWVSTALGGGSIDLVCLLNAHHAVTARKRCPRQKRREIIQRKKGGWPEHPPFVDWKMILAFDRSPAWAATMNLTELRLRP